MGQEILTAVEFAQRLKVGRTKIFEWIRDGVLVPGRHFVKIGRIVRFNWCDDVLFTLEKPKAKTKLTKIIRQVTAEAFLQQHMTQLYSEA